MNQSENLTEQKRDSFIIYRSFYEAILDLPKESQTKVWEAICEYSLNFKDIELSGIESTIFKLIKPNLEANRRKFINGKKAKNKQDESKDKANQEQNESKIEASVKQIASKTEANVDVNVDLDENENKELVINGVSLLFPIGKSFDFKKAFQKLGVEEHCLSDWIKVRKQKKGVNTFSAFERVINQINLARISPNEAIKLCAEKSWLGFEADWYFNINKPAQTNSVEGLMGKELYEKMNWKNPPNLTRTQKESLYDVAPNAYQNYNLLIEQGKCRII
jgi:hypothetical protein